jgi:hypothetical protein
MLALVDLVLVLELSQIGYVSQQLVKTGLGKYLTATFRTLPGDPSFIDPAALVKLPNHCQQRLMFKIQLINGTDTGCLVLVDDEL